MVAGWSFDGAGVVFVAGALYFVVEDVEGEGEGGGGEGEGGDRHLGLSIVLYKVLTATLYIYPIGQHIKINPGLYRPLKAGQYKP